MSDDERKELHLEARMLMISPGLYMEVDIDEHEKLRERGFFGYANYYLFNRWKATWNEEELVNRANLMTYKRLLEIEAKLGTTQTEQLFECVSWSARIELIKV